MGGATPPNMRELLFAHLLSPAEQAEVAGAGDAPCDVVAEGAPAGVRCPFRKGHACPCRWFGDVMGGEL
jgi:hypothetical protein